MSNPCFTLPGKPGLPAESAPTSPPVSVAPPPPAADEGLRSLALRAGTGDQDALTALVRATTGVVRAVCARLVDRESADDLVQETFARAVRSLPSYRGDADAVTWLVAIARRVCADEIGRRRRARLVTVVVRAQREPTRTEVAASVELSDAIGRLPDRRREAFLLTAVAGFSYAEAAAACACPVGTIRSRVARAREDLVDALAVTAHA